jgi:hypothetical protein
MAMRMSKDHLALLRALRDLVSDVEAMRDSTRDGFGPFSESAEETDGTHISWPNLRITLAQAKRVLESKERF